MCDWASGVEVSAGGAAAGGSDLLRGAGVGAAVVAGVEVAEDEAVVVLLPRKGELTLRSTAPKGLAAGCTDEDEAVGGETEVGAAALLTITGALYNDMIDRPPRSKRQQITYSLPVHHKGAQTSSSRISSLLDWIDHRVLRS